MNTGSAAPLVLDWLKQDIVMHLEIGKMGISTPSAELSYCWQDVAYKAPNAGLILGGVRDVGWELVLFCSPPREF